MYKVIARVRVKLIELLLGRDIGIVRGAKIEEGMLTGAEGIKYLDVSGMHSDGIGFSANNGLYMKAQNTQVKNAEYGFQARNGSVINAIKRK